MSLSVTLYNTLWLILLGLYCSGWVKTGPAGGLLTTRASSYETADSILEDYKQGKIVSSNYYISHKIVSSYILLLFR